jgi:hypothetical protein
MYRSLGYRIQGLDPLIVQIQQCFIRLAVGSSNASTTAELLEMYQEWQHVTAAQVSKKQVHSLRFAFCKLKVAVKVPTLNVHLLCCWICFAVVDTPWFLFVDQAELGFQIEGVEAVAMKLLQRLNYSASVIKTSAAYLQDG